eukprot:193327-Ditylum_brightwellii.AAC.1
MGASSCVSDCSSFIPRKCDGMFSNSTNISNVDWRVIFEGFANEDAWCIWALDILLGGGGYSFYHLEGCISAGQQLKPGFRIQVGKGWVHILGAWSNHLGQDS